MTNPVSRFVQHFRSPQAPRRANNVATYAPAYTRTPRVNEVLGGVGSQKARSDFRVLSDSYDRLTDRKQVDVHFVCNGNNATIRRQLGNTFVLHGRLTGRPFDPYAKDDVVRISPSGVSGRNGNSGQPLTQDQQQMLVEAAKFALGRGFVKSTPFSPDVRMNRL